MVYGDVVYYAAGIWPSDGVYVHALDAETGKVVWSNTESGSLLMNQPHGGAQAESGIAPQGYLLADEDHLYVPTGRAVPAVLDRRTGKLLYYHLQANRDVGGIWVMLSDRFFLNGGAAFERTDGKAAGRVGLPPMAGADRELVQASGNALKRLRWIDATRRDRKGNMVAFRALEPIRVIDLDDSVTALIVASADAVCGFSGRIAAIDFKAQANMWWEAPVEGTVLGLAYSHGHLIATTDTGLVYCFAGSPPPPRNPPSADAGEREESTPTDELARRILEQSDTRDGYALVLDAGDGRLLERLVRNSRLYVVGLARSDRDLERSRRRLQSSGLYGTRASVVRDTGNLAERLPPRFANLIVRSMSGDGKQTSPLPERIAALLQPYNGIACAYGESGRVQVIGRGVPPVGGGSWTHQWADSKNTGCSNDEILRGNLAMAWFGSFAFRTPNRHGQGPAPLSHRGHLVVGGVDGITCLDAFNGTQRWTYEIPGLLADFDGIHHDVGVGETGGRFCLSDDAVFVPWEEHCLRIDLATGACTDQFKTPVPSTEPNRRWGVVFHNNGTLVGSVLNEAHRVSPRYALTRLRTESCLIFAVDAKSGKLLWRYEPRHSVRNNAVVVTEDRVYLIDRPIAPQDRIDQPKRNGRPGPRLKPGDQPTGTLVALDLRSGDTIWSQSDQVWGTQLSVSHDSRTILMSYQAMKHKFFRLPSEVGGRLAAFDAASGRRLWDREASYVTRPIINGSTILAEGGAWDIRSGKPLPFPFRRSYGCGQLAAGKHILLYRSATLGYWDLSLPADEQRTRSFGGLRPGCYINAIPAGGLVLVPEGSTKCRCSYQLKSWFALRPAQTAR